LSTETTMIYRVNCVIHTIVTVCKPHIFSEVPRIDATNYVKQSIIKTVGKLTDLLILDLG
jgi:hypothetical protein